VNIAHRRVASAHKDRKFSKLYIVEFHLVRTAGRISSEARKASSPGQFEHSKFPLRSTSVGIIVSCIVGKLPEDAIVLGAR
jgi:hypothetical protein